MKTELVTNLKRRTTEVIAEVRETGDAVLITERGRPAAYLVDVDAYEEMNRRISVLEGIALGEQALREGRVHTQAQARKRFARWLS